MEQMMGVKERLTDKLQTEGSPNRSGARMLDLIHLLNTLAGVITNYFRLGRRIKQFYERLHKALNAYGLDLAKFRPDELIDIYADLEKRLLKKWDAPIVNDFFAMILGLLDLDKQRAIRLFVHVQMRQRTRECVS